MEGKRQAKQQVSHKLRIIDEEQENINDLENDVETYVLIKWTEALDFDQYFENWTHLATSGPSEPIHLKPPPQRVFDAQNTLDVTLLEKETERSYTPQTQISFSDLILK